MTRWSIAAVVALVLGMPGAASAGWRAECRALARDCRKSRGAILTTTTTTIPFSSCLSENCHGHCVQVDGQAYVLVWDAVSGDCEIESPPAPITTTTTMTATTTTTIHPLLFWRW